MRVDVLTIRVKYYGIDSGAAVEGARKGGMRCRGGIIRPRG
jgi:hypothetical protein